MASATKAGSLGVPVDAKLSPVVVVTAFATAAWVAIHLFFRDSILYHDSWKHNFAISFGFAKQAACADFPAWMGAVDNGSPAALYLISQSLTQVTRLANLLLQSCLHPGVATGLLLHKFQVLGAYALFAGGLFVLGRELFRHRASAWYLFVATLFAGLCLDASHSDQVVNEVFWLPWIAICAARYLREQDERLRGLLAGAASVMFCLQLLDHYPHMATLAALVGAASLIIAQPSVVFRLRAPGRAGTAVAALALLLTVVHLWLVLSTLRDYIPSQRAEVKVDPNLFGETGFVQASAFIGVFLPHTFMAGFDHFADGMALVANRLGAKPGARWFIFRLDALLFYLGFVPCALMLALVFVRERGRAVAGWAVFTIAFLLLSMEHTRLYLLAFHLPFFDVFRGYFLLAALSAFGALVLSGYGLDRLLSLPVAERRLAIRRAVTIMFALTAVSAAALLVMLRLSGWGRPSIYVLSRPLLADLMLIALGCFALRALLAAQAAIRGVAWMAALLAAGQATYFVTNYSVLGTPTAGYWATVGFGREDLEETYDGWRDRLEIGPRHACSTFAECYLAPRDTVSVRTDLEGTFLRHRGEPHLQPGLAPEEKRMYSALSGPSAWLVAPGNTAGSPALHAPAGVKMLERGPDRIRYAYDAPEPGSLVVATNFDRGWRARVNGMDAEIKPAGVGGMALPVPAGRGEVELRYSSAGADLLFGGRYLLALLGVLALVWLARTSFSRSVPS